MKKGNLYRDQDWSAGGLTGGGGKGGFASGPKFASWPGIEISTKGYKGRALIMFTSDPYNFPPGLELLACFSPRARIFGIIFTPGPKFFSTP